MPRASKTQPLFQQLITSKNPQTLLVILLIVLAFFSGYLFFKVQSLEKKVGVAGTQQAGNQPQAPQAPQANFDAMPKVTDKDHIRGSKDAEILLVEYSDFECPFCKRFHPTMQQILKEYGNRVAWVYRHFPLDQIHSKADKEAEAVECAGRLGGNDGFWNMTDKIFEVTPSNNGLDLETLPDLAQQVGLDRNAFKQCLDSGKYAKHVEEDYQGGVKLGINGTPGTVIVAKNGKKDLIGGALSFEQAKQQIDALLK